MRNEASLPAELNVAAPGGMESNTPANPNVLDERTAQLIAAEGQIYIERTYRVGSGKIDNPLHWGLCRKVPKGS